MNPPLSRVVTLMLLGGLALCGCRKEQTQPPADVAASNSFLECVTQDLLGGQRPILRLAEPGMCPGHFDIRPSQVDQLRKAKVLLRFDFQKSLDERLTGPAGGGPRVVEVRVGGGLCEPASYLTACRQVADAFVDAGLMPRQLADHKLGWITQRLSRQEENIRQSLAQAGLQDRPVITSAHQEAFCRWLGLKVVATFNGSDTAGVGQLDRAVRDGEQAGVKVVIANLPEGRQVADALAQRLGARVAVFGNFPTLNAGKGSFDDLLAANVATLVEVTGK